VDADFSMGREYVPADCSSERPHVNESWFIISCRNKYDLFELADTCIALSDSFLRDNGLLPSTQENQQVNGERPGALQSAADFVSL
jgi:hypothetical protein